MLSVDLNCDMGEGMDSDAAIFPFISSANIACGYHAGDPDTMRRTVEWALRHHVAIGAHPSYRDRENFGRTDLLGKSVQLEEIPGLVVDQLILLQGICSAFGARLHHVKPHGALYNRAAKDPAVSSLICRAIREFDPSLFLYGLSGSVMKTAAAQQGIRFVSEVFADRTYQDDGTLTPRTASGALIVDAAVSVRQALMMVQQGRTAIHGRQYIGGENDTAAGGPMMISLLAETICLHGDGDHALEFAQTIHAALTAEGIDIQAPKL